MATWKCNKCGATTSTKPANMQHSCGGGWRKKQEEDPNYSYAPSAETMPGFSVPDYSSDSSTSPDPAPYEGGGGDFGGGGSSGEW